MTQKHDYKAALEGFDRQHDFIWLHRHKAAIHHALLIADKVTGISSSKMDTVAQTVFEERISEEHYIEFYDHAEYIFKAMIAQALKEISDEK